MVSGQTEVAVVLTTVRDLEEGRTLARALVRSGLAGCVTLVPQATSIYRWQDGIAEETETMLVIKTPRDRLESLRRDLAGRHPYELPEFLVLEVSAGSPEYLAWLRDSTRFPLEER